MLPLASAINVNQPPSEPSVARVDWSSPKKFLNKWAPDDFDFTVSPDTEEAIDKAEERISYLTLAGEGLRQVSEIPLFLSRHASGLLAFLQARGFAKLAVYFELAGKGSIWLRLDPAHLKALEKAARHLTRLELGCLRGLRTIGRLLPWAGPAAAGWDVFKAVREHNPQRKAAAVGTATWSVGVALLSFAFPGVSMVLLAVQMWDLVKGQPASTWLGRVLQNEWARSSRRQSV